MFEVLKKSVVKNRDSLPTNGDSLQRWAIASAAPMLYDIFVLAKALLRARNHKHKLDTQLRDGPNLGPGACYNLFYF